VSIFLTKYNDRKWKTGTKLFTLVWISWKRIGTRQKEHLGSVQHTSIKTVHSTKFYWFLPLFFFFWINRKWTNQIKKVQLAFSPANFDDFFLEISWLFVLHNLMLRGFFCLYKKWLRKWGKNGKMLHCGRFMKRIISKQDGLCFLFCFFLVEIIQDHRRAEDSNSRLQ